MQRASHLYYSILHNSKRPACYHLRTRTTALSTRCFTQLRAYQVLLRRPSTTRPSVSAKTRLQLSLVSSSIPTGSYPFYHCSNRSLAAMAPTDRDILPETYVSVGKSVRIDTKGAAALSLFIMTFHFMI